MEKTYISITITNYSNHYIAPEVHYFEDDGVHPRISRWDLDVNTANKLAWELVKKGGKNTFKSNQYNNAISERQVSFWGYM